MRHDDLKERMGSASIGSSSSSSKYFRVFRSLLVFLRRSSSAATSMICYKSSLTSDWDLLMLVTRSLRAAARGSVGRVHKDVARVALNPGFHLVRREEFIKARGAARACAARATG